MFKTIESIRSASNHEWDRIWGDNKCATYYQSREWAEIWNTCSNNFILPSPRLVVFKNGAIALLPVSYISKYKKAVKMYISSLPLNSLKYGGWISNDNLTAHQIEDVLLLILKKYKNIELMINPFDASHNAVSEYSHKKYGTYYIDLTKGYKEIYSNFKSQCRNKINKAHKNNVRVTIAETEEEWLDYYSMYLNTVQRWDEDNSIPYQSDLFKELFLRKSRHIKLWLALYDGKPIAGSITLQSKNIISSWHSSFIYEYRHVGPTNILQDEIIKYACENGYSVYDLGHTGGRKNLVEYKMSFGASKIATPVIKRRHGIVSIIEKILNR